MTKLVWDEPGTRSFETGIDRGVLSVEGGTPVSWNGLTSVQEESSAESSQSYYLDGIKYLETFLLKEFSGTLTAYTYPDEFLEVEGVEYYANGLYVAEQPLKTFNLCYRTRIGNDIDGIEHGYKIHFLYNLTARPSSKTYSSIAENAEPIDFSWDVSSITSEHFGYLRPSSHVIIDSRKTPWFVLEDLETLVYGDADNDPYFPTIMDLLTMFYNPTPPPEPEVGTGLYPSSTTYPSSETYPGESGVSNGSGTYPSSTTYPSSSTYPSL